MEHKNNHLIFRNIHGNSWKNCSWNTPKSTVEENVEENVSTMLIWVMHSSFSSKVDPGWLTSESLVSSDILLLFFL